jgi:cytidyltransferase-like protein
MTGGGFDPIHPGHVSLILESKQYGDVLVVIVNGDNFLKTKKGKPFQDLKTRSLIVSGLRGVDYVVPFEIKNDMTVTKAIEKAFLASAWIKNGHPAGSWKHGPTLCITRIEKWGRRRILKV